MKTKSIILIAISLGFGLVAAIGMTHVMGKSKSNTQAEVVKEINVLVAKADVDIQQVLSPEDVVMKSFRPSQVPEGVANSLEDILDMRSTSRVAKGNFILKGFLEEKTKMKTIAIPKGYSVYSIKPSMENTFLNSLRPGDRIDIIGILRKPGKERTQIAKTFLKNIRVFGINDKLDRVRTEEKVSIKLVQVLLRPRQAEQLALVQSVGKIQFVMRPETESAVEIEDEEPEEDENNAQGASLAIIFGDNELDDPVQNGMLQQQQQAAISDLPPMPEEDVRKPFTMRFIGGDGAVEYNWADRQSLPTMNGEGAGSPVSTSAPTAPQTYGPENGVPAPPISSEANYDDSEEGSESAGAYSGMKEPESK